VFVPNTIQLSRELVQAELEGKAPAGTSLAAAAFTMNSVTRETAKEIIEQYSLNRQAAVIAWKYLETGKIVTVPTATKSEPEVESPENTEVNQATEATVSTTIQEIKDTFKRHFPDWPALTVQQAEEFQTKLRYPYELDDILFQMANGSKEITNPIVLAFWKFNNEQPDKHRQDRQMIQRKGITGDTLIRRAMREAEAMIPDLVKPEATTETVDNLRALRERVERGRA
jgi:hypothetical protein